MLDKLIRKLEKAGKLRKQKVGFVQIEALLKEATLDNEMGFFFDQKLRYALSALRYAGS